MPETESSARNLEAVKKYIGKELVYDSFLEEVPNLLRSLIYFSLDFCTRSSKKKRTLFQDNPNLIMPYFGTNSYHQILHLAKDFFQNSRTDDSGLSNLTLYPEEVQILQQEEFTIRQIVLDEEAKTRFLGRMGNLPRREALEKQISLLPVLQMQVETLAGDVADDTFTDRDFVTFRFRITKNATDGVAFLPSYGYLKREKFYLTLEASDELLFFEEVVFEPGQTECLV